jgi:hypothetical protein
MSTRVALASTQPFLNPEPRTLHPAPKRLFSQEEEDARVLREAMREGDEGDGGSVYSLHGEYNTGPKPLTLNIGPPS